MNNRVISLDRVVEVIGRSNVLFHQLSARRGQTKGILALPLPERKRRQRPWNNLTPPAAVLMVLSVAKGFSPVNQAIASPSISCCGVESPLSKTIIAETDLELMRLAQ
jgi:hypothetical protein